MRKKILVTGDWVQSTTLTIFLFNTGDIQERIVDAFHAGSERAVNDQALTKEDLSQPRYI